MAKKPKTDDRQYIFHVTDLLTWQVMIFRYVVVKETDKSVTVLLGNGKEKRYARESDSGFFTKDIDEAKKIARRLLRQRKTVIKEYKAKIARSEENIKANIIHDVRPMDSSKIDSSKFKF